MKKLKTVIKDTLDAYYIKFGTNVPACDELTFYVNRYLQPLNDSSICNIHAMHMEDNGIFDYLKFARLIEEYHGIVMDIKNNEDQNARIITETKSEQNISV